MPTIVHYYVWYKVAADPLGARAAVDAMMADVARRTRIAGRLLLRRDEPDTWMEIYEGVAESALFERELAAAVLRHGITQFIATGARHVEAFVAAA